jgi:sugar/nucleoside kinase (ribokinase family)
MITSKNITDNREIVSAIVKCTTIIIIDPPLDVATILSIEGKNRGKTIIISPALLTRQGFATIGKYLGNADYVILNQQEAKFLASVDDSIAACSKLSNMLNGKRIITTLGKKGCVFCHENKRTIIPTIDLTHFGLKVRSTAGAGDSFVGAFGAFKSKGLDDLESIFLANIAAALKTTSEETRGSPAYDEIRHYADHEFVRSLYNQISFI